MFHDWVPNNPTAKWKTYLYSPQIIYIFTDEEIEVLYEKDTGWGHIIVKVQVCV